MDKSRIEETPEGSLGNQQGRVVVSLWNREIIILKAIWEFYDLVEKAESLNLDKFGSESCLFCL